MIQNTPLNSAIQEIQQAQSLMIQIQSLIKLSPRGDAYKESAIFLTKEVMQICSSALFKLEPEKIKIEAQTESSSPTSSFYSSLCPGDPDAGPTQRRRGTKRLRDSEEVLTTVPDNDGYQWRKYGEKRIAGATFPRLYYRCSYTKDQGCRAKKQVQQQNADYPPMYLVTYCEEHTCSTPSFVDISDHRMPDLAPAKPFLLKFDPKACETKQEEHFRLTSNTSFLLKFDPKACETKQEEHFLSTSNTFSPPSLFDKLLENPDPSNIPGLKQTYEVPLPTISTAALPFDEETGTPRSEAFSATIQPDSPTCMSIKSMEMKDTDFIQAGSHSIDFDELLMAIDFDNPEFF